MDEFDFVLIVDFCPQQLHKCFDGIWFNPVLPAPDTPDNRLAAEDSIGSSHEELQQGMLRFRKRDGFARPCDLTGCGIQFEITDLQLRALNDGAAPSDRSQSSHEFGESERLGEVVIYAQIESAYCIRDSIPGCEHQYGYLVPSLADFLRDLKTINVRQHEIEDDGIEGAGLHLCERILTCESEHRRMGLFFEGPLQHLSHIPLVFDNQNAHFLRPPRRNELNRSTQGSNEQFVGFFSQFSAFSNLSVSVLTIGALADARRSAEFGDL
jgi:hypothetical protein